MAASGYGCEFGDCTAPVNHLVTTFQPGSTVSLCDEHYPAGLIPLLAAELGLEPGEFYADVERIIKREAKKAERALAGAQAAEAAQGSQGPAAPAGPLDGDPASHADDKSMADIIPEDWSGEAS